MTSVPDCLMVAPVTPMDRWGRIVLEHVEPLARALLAHGARGFFILGSTGEGMLMTLDERRKLAETWRRAVPDRVPLIVHVGHPCLEDCATLAQHAQQIGATATAIASPRVVPVRKIEQVVALAAACARATPQLPFYYYHNGPLPGLTMKAAPFLRLAAERIPNLAGLKFTDSDLNDFSQCLQFDGRRFHIMFGLDEILLPAMSMGARTAVGGTFNITMPLAQQVADAFAENRLADAERAQLRLNEVIAVLQRFAGISAVKASMRLLGVECGPPRLPLLTLTEPQEEELLELLQRQIADLLPKPAPVGEPGLVHP